MRNKSRLLKIGSKYELILHQIQDKKTELNKTNDTNKKKYGKAKR